MRYKRILSIILISVLLIVMIPFTAFANTNKKTITKAGTMISSMNKKKTVKVNYKKKRKAKKVNNNRKKKTARTASASNSKSSKILSVNDAIKLINKKVPNSNKNNYELTTKDTYVTNKKIKSSCYIFNEYNKLSDAQSDSNICVNKNTGKVFRYYPDGNPIINY